MRRIKSILDLFQTPGQVTTSLGTMPKQYHVSNSNTLLIYGSINYHKVYDHINTITMNQEHTYYPIKYKNDRALMVIWMSHFFESNHGDHNELNFSTFVSKNAQLVEYDDIDINQTPYSLFNEISDATKVSSTPCCIYNNDEKVVSYNKEYLNLPVQLAKGDGLTINSENVKFEWINKINGRIPIKATSTSFNDFYKLYKALGFKSLYEMISAPYQYGNVLNLDGLSADVYLQAPPKDTKIFSWNGDNSEIEIQDDIVRQFEYKPFICCYYNNLRFVYQPSQQDR